MAGVSIPITAVDEVSTVLDRVASRVEDFTSKLSMGGNAGSQAFSGVSQSAETAASSTDRAAHAAEGLTSSLNAGGKAADDAANKYSEVGEEAEGAGDNTEEFGESSINAANALESLIAAAGVVKVLQEVSQALMEAADAAMQFELSMAKVATLAEPTGASISKMSEEIKAIAGETGRSANEIAEATYQAISGSVDAAEATKFTAEATKLSIAGFTQTETAVDVLTTAINAYNLSISDTEKVSSMLVKTQDLGKTSVDKLAASMGQVIPTAAAYGVDLENLSTAYAEMTRTGVETSIATTYMRAMFQELGSTSSEVSKILQNETGQSFTELMNSGMNLGEVLQILGDSVNGDTTAFANLWSNMTAGQGALSLFNVGAERFTSVLGEMENSSGTVGRNFETMADTTIMAKDRFTTSVESMKASIGNSLTPAFEEFYNAGSSVTEWIGDFAAKNPAVVAGLTATAVAAGVVVAGITAYVVVAKAAAVITPILSKAALALGTSISGMLGPIGLAIAGIGALVGVIAAVSGTYDEAQREFNELTAVSKQHYTALAEVRAEHERAVETYGKNSSAAQELAGQMAILEAQYESNKQTLEAYQAETEAMISSHEELMTQINEGATKFEKESKVVSSLTDRLGELSSKNKLSSFEQNEMLYIVGQLNQQFPELGLSIDDATGKMSQSIGVIEQATKAYAEQQYQQQQMEAIGELQVERLENERLYLEAVEQTRAAKERADKEGYGWQNANSQARQELAFFTEQEEIRRAALEQTDDAIERHKTILEDITRAEEEAANMPVDSYEAVSQAISGVSERMGELATAYDEAFTSARSGIDSTIGLFDVMETKASTSASKITEAWQSQIQYLQDYQANVDYLSEAGISNDVLSQFSDGSQESANAIAGIRQELEGLGTGTEAAAAKVSELESTFAQLDSQKDSFASMSADITTGFSEGMASLEGEMQSMVEGMNMSDEARTSATETIAGYTEEIMNGIESGSTAAESVAQATTSALEDAAGAAASMDTTMTAANTALTSWGARLESTAGSIASRITTALGNIKMPSLGGSTISSKIPGFATGTTNAPEAFIAGEEGPELVVGHGGATVYTADETADILSKSQDSRLLDIPGPTPEEVAQGGATGGGEGVFGEKVIRIEINGSGAIDVPAGADEETMVQIMQDNLRPVLLDIIRKEKYEEGDGTYDY